MLLAECAGGQEAIEENLMATPEVRASLTSSWADVSGDAASVAGVTWQNIGPSPIHIAFTTTAPGDTDAFHVLKAGEAFYDKNGSAHVWARYTGHIASILCATAD
jgi:hypothetical protein